MIWKRYLEKKPAICEDGGQEKPDCCFVWNHWEKVKRLDMLESAGKLDLSGVRGKRESVFISSCGKTDGGSQICACDCEEVTNEARFTGCFIYRKNWAYHRLSTGIMSLPKRREYVFLTEKRFFCFKGTVGEIPRIFY